MPSIGRVANAIPTHAHAYEEFNHPHPSDPTVLLSGEICSICGQKIKLKWNGMSWPAYKVSLGIKPQDPAEFGRTYR